MDRDRVTSLLTLALVLAGCLDATTDRTRRDFEEVGRAHRGRVRISIDQGVCALAEAEGSRLRCRANAPEVALTFTSDEPSDETFSVEVENLASDASVEGPATDVRTGRKSVSFATTVPAGGTATIALRREVHAAGAFRFVWVGDVHSRFERLARLVEQVNADASVELVLFAGDLSQAGEPDEIARVVEEADGLEVPWYSVIGNHDTFGGNDKVFQERIGRVNVRFDYRGVRFVLVDSAWATLDDRVHAFLRQSLAGGPPAKVIAMHIPPLDYAGLRDRGFASRQEGNQVMAELADGGVDLAIAGHVHTLHTGHWAGIETVVSGNGCGYSGMTGDGTDAHFLVIDASPSSERFEVTRVDVP